MIQQPYLMVCYTDQLMWAGVRKENTQTCSHLSMHINQKLQLLTSTSWPINHVTIETMQLITTYIYSSTETLQNLHYNDKENYSTDSVLYECSTFCVTIRYLDSHIMSFWDLLNAMTFRTHDISVILPWNRTFQSNLSFLWQSIHNKVNLQ